MVQSAQIAEHVINGPFVTIAKQALNQIGNKYPNNGLIQLYVGWQKQGLDMLQVSDLVGNLADNVRLGIQGYHQLKAGNLKGGELSIAEATNPGVKMVVGETKLVKSAVNGNMQSLGRVGFQAASLLVGGEDMMADPEALDVGVAGTVTRSLDDLNSLRGATEEEVRNLIPKNWGEGVSLKKGEGIKYTVPGTKGIDTYMIEKGNPNAPKDNVHSGPYLRVTRGGKTIRIP